MQNNSPKIYLMDGSVFVFRSYYSVPDQFSSPQGHATNAVFGFAGHLCNLLENSNPSHVAVCFDEALESSFRNDLYPPYKANRDPAPEDLKRQFQWCRAVSEAMGITCFSHSRYEADDLIGTLHRIHKQRGHPVCILSSDKDLAQLMDEQDEMWDMKGPRQKQQQIEDKFDVRCEQIADFLAISGDKVDNIPGIPGVGPKAAAALLKHYDDLDGIYRHIDEVPYLSIRGAASLQKKLKEHEEAVRLYRRITEIHCHADNIDENVELARGKASMDVVNQLFDNLGFGHGLRSRIGRLA